MTTTTTTTASPPQRERLLRIGEVVEVVDPRLPALRVPRAQRRRDELLEQRRLAVGRRPERAQVARVDAVTCQLRAHSCDVDVRLRVALVGPRAGRREETERLELAREVGRDAGACTQLVEVDPPDALGDGRPRMALPLLRAGRVELLADHAQRQEAVALQAEDRLKPLDVVLA